ncbi:MAG: GNAT family N-acetyltransferase [Bacteroidota bacterium]
MHIHTESERLYFRNILPQDEKDLFEMDSDPAVHRFLGNNPVTSTGQIREVIGMLTEQYKQNGIARWAVIDKHTHEWIGWAGLKYYGGEGMNGHTHFYEHGYRFKQKHWGKGYATEASRAILAYGFQKLGVEKIYAITEVDHLDSQHVLLKLGFRNAGTFDYEYLEKTFWFELTKESFSRSPQKGRR